MSDLIVPNHVQHWPDNLLKHRLEEFVLLDGRPPTWNSAIAPRTNAQAIISAVDRAYQKLGLPKLIDSRYYVGTAQHETNFKYTEWDTEVATQRCIPGFQSVGVYQIGNEEAEGHGYHLRDMLDLDKATECLVKMAEDHRHWIRQYAKIPDGDPDPVYVDEKGRVWEHGTLRAYLAIAHNHGLGYARLTILRYGLNWPAYKIRNPQDHIVDHNYGEDCVTGGPSYPADPPLVA